MREFLLFLRAKSNWVSRSDKLWCYSIVNGLVFFLFLNITLKCLLSFLLKISAHSDRMIMQFRLLLQRLAQSCKKVSRLAAYSVFVANNDSSTHFFLPRRFTLFGCNLFMHSTSKLWADYSLSKQVCSSLTRGKSLETHIRVDFVRWSSHN